jgi:DNA-binding PadR family transcriptional regulator
MAVSHGPAHAWSIRNQVSAATGGQITLGPGTLYGLLTRLTKAGLVSESEPEGDGRVYYSLTAEGNRDLDAELDRYRTIVAFSTARATPDSTED